VAIFNCFLEARGTTTEEKITSHKGWYEVVENYAEQKLTKESDKIPAIVGVADFIQKSVNRRFVAGMWFDTLDLNLLWNVKVKRA
jgi:hypothetical protein